MGVNLEGKTGVIEIGVGIGAGIETKGVGYTGKHEETLRANEVRLEKIRARKESGRISAEIAQKGKNSGWRQGTKDSGLIKVVFKADCTSCARAAGHMNGRTEWQGRGGRQQRKRRQSRKRRRNRQ